MGLGMIAKIGANFLCRQQEGAAPAVPRSSPGRKWNNAALRGRASCCAAAGKGPLLRTLPLLLPARRLQVGRAEAAALPAGVKEGRRCGGWGRSCGGSDGPRGAERWAPGGGWAVRGGPGRVLRLRGGRSPSLLSQPASVAGCAAALRSPSVPVGPCVWSASPQSRQVTLSALPGFGSSANYSVEKAI